MLPSPQEILGFIEIAHTKNITQAASRLGVTQPSLSQALKKLEHSLGEPLVLRSKKGIELTLAGKHFLSYAQKLADLWNEAKNTTHKSVRSVAGRVSLGCHPSVGLYSLDKVIPQLIQQYPKVEISLHHDLSRKIVDQVVNFELLLGLVINPIKHPDLILKKILTDEVHVWESSHCQKDVLIIHPDLIQTQSLLKKIKKTHIQFTRIITSNNLEVITTLALKGTGYAIIPKRVVSLFDSKGLLRVVKNSPSFKDELYLAYRVENKNIEVVKVFRDIILNSLTDR
jgi:DNA-binding transcriptional LysR family regulator